jgi:isocitrate/isopropylmalate dehydrogenase
MSGVMMLNHLNQREIGEKIKTAYNAVLAEGNPEHRTADIGGTGTTESFVQAILRKL